MLKFRHWRIGCYIHTSICFHVRVFITNVIFRNVCLCWFWCTGTRKVISNQEETSCLSLLNAGFEPRVSGTESPRLNARWKTNWAIEDQTKISKSTARPYGQRAFSPLDPTTDMASPLALNALRCLPSWNYKWHNVFSRRFFSVNFW